MTDTQWLNEAKITIRNSWIKKIREIGTDWKRCCKSELAQQWWALISPIWRLHFLPFSRSQKSFSFPFSDKYFAVLYVRIGLCCWLSSETCCVVLLLYNIFRVIVYSVFVDKFLYLKSPLPAKRSEDDTVQNNGWQKKILCACVFNVCFEKCAWRDNIPEETSSCSFAAFGRGFTSGRWVFIFLLLLKFKIGMQRQ